MEKTLGDFVVALRKADLEVSPAETLTAMSALQIIGFHDRKLLRDSLSIILAKTPEEKALFDICFERFFSFSQFRGARTQRPGLQEKGTGQSPGQGAETDERGKRRHRQGAQGPRASKLGHLLANEHLDELAVLMKQAAESVHLNQIRTLRERSLYARRILLHMGIDALDAEIAALSRADDTARQEMAQVLIEGRAYLADQVRTFVDEQYLLVVDGTGARFLAEAVSQTQLTNMQVYYFEHIREAVRKLANQLARKHAKRRKINNRGQLDIRRTLRRNMQYDGALFDIRWKQTRLQRPRVFVLCDVSGSVRNVSRFLLTFLYSLTEVLPRVRAFAFSNNLGEVTALFDHYPLAEAIEMSLDDFGKGSTDYGQALRRFRELALQDIDNRSTVIILGDSRNNYYATAADELKLIAGKARQVIWLNPEPRDKWQEGDAEMKSYLPFCTYAEVCNSLTDLERMVSRILRTAR
ncbi:MAG: VWA domain-containing protein [Pseudomonadota bacterium]